MINESNEAQSLLSSSTEQLQANIQGFLFKNWFTLGDDVKLEIADCLGLSISIISNYISQNNCEKLFKNTGRQRKYGRTLKQISKLLISLIASGGGFKTGVGLNSTLSSIGVGGLNESGVVAFNIFGGLSLATFFSTGDYSKTHQFLSKEFASEKKMKATVYLALLLLNAILSGIFSYTGAPGTLRVFGVSDPGDSTLKTVGGMLALFNFIANMALTGGAASDFKNISSRSAIFPLFLTYLASMLMYMIAPFDANLFKVNALTQLEKAPVLMLGGLASFYSAVVMANILIAPKDNYKKELNNVKRFLQSFKKGRTQNSMIVVFILMTATLLVSLLVLFGASNISSAMWFIGYFTNEPECSAPTGNSTTLAIDNGCNNFADFSSGGGISLLTYMLINFFTLLIVLGVVSLNGARELLQGFRPYGISEAVFNQIKTRIPTVDNAINDGGHKPNAENVSSDFSEA
jgi:hypothetical protein